MLDGISQQRPVPDELLGPLAEATSCLINPETLRRSFAEHGYVLLRDVLPRDEVLAARSEVFSRLAEVGEIQQPVEAGLSTGTRNLPRTWGRFGNRSARARHCGA